MFVSNVAKNEGALRIDSPLYFVYRSPTQKRKPYRYQSEYSDKLSLKKHRANHVTSKENVGGVAIEKSKNSSSHEKEPDVQPNTRLNIAIKETKLPLPREMIEARGAFNTIKNYCKKFMSTSIGRTANNRDDNRKNSIALNFFGKPIVERPISLP